MSDLGEWGVFETEPDDEEQGAQEPFYANVDEFVIEQLAPTYRRELEGPGRTWCPEWWRHEEAIARLEALWRAWEHLRLDPATGISVWFRDHADHHMAVLLDPDGPFKGCSPERGHSSRLEPLPAEPAPEGTFNAAAADDEPFDPTDDVADDEPFEPTDDVADDEPFEPTDDVADDEPFEPSDDVADDEPVATADDTGSDQTIDARKVARP